MIAEEGARIVNGMPDKSLAKVAKAQRKPFLINGLSA
jgi:hypothetical protein